MLTQLFFDNLHFFVKVFAFLVFFSTGWLHLSSWQLDKKSKSLLLRSIGFFLIAFVSATYATSIDIDLVVLSTKIVQILGLTFIWISLAMEPLLKPPKKQIAGLSLLLISQSLTPLSAVLFLIIAITYLRKSTEGLEKQIRPVFFAFLILSLSEFINISFFAEKTNIVFLSKQLAEFGPIWVISIIIELIGLVVLGIWTWGYIRFRIQVQLFITFVTVSLVIFTITTATFTFLLLNNFKNDAENHLKTDVKVLEYSIERIKSEALTSAKVVAENSDIISAVEKADSDEIYNITLKFMLSLQTDFMEVTDKAGVVIMRTNDNENIGDNQGEDPVVKSALSGNPLSSVAVKSAAIAPEVQIRASAPIILEDELVGSVVTGFNIDNAFVDGVKEVTGLDVSVFAEDIRAATTFVASDGKTRFIGTRESNSEVISSVLEKKEIYIGSAHVLNQPFLTAYTPLFSSKNEVIGMLFVGKLQTELYNTAKQSIELSFLGSVVLIVLSLLPAYFLARYISKNLKA